MKTTTEFDIDKMAKDLGLPTDLIRLQLGLPYEEEVPGLEGFDDVNTLEEFESFWRSIRPGSEAQQHVVVKWNKLAKEELDKAITLEEVRRVYDYTFGESEVCQQALEKWLQLVTSVAEAEELYNQTLADSEIEVRVLEKWLSLATTLEEVQEVYECASEGTEFMGRVIEKLAPLYGYQKEEE